MTFREVIYKMNPSVSKKTLFLVAGLLWGIAATKILYIAFQAFMESTPDYLIVIPIILAGYFLFFRFLFLKIVKKHTRRIINKEKEKTCMFSFLDLKSYMIMAVMITLGITVRKFHLIPLISLGTTYCIMGVTLLTAAFMFLYAGIRYMHYKELYLVKKT